MTPCPFCGSDNVTPKTLASVEPEVVWLWKRRHNAAWEFVRDDPKPECGDVPFRRSSPELEALMGQSDAGSPATEPFYNEERLARLFNSLYSHFADLEARIADLEAKAAPVADPLNASEPIYHGMMEPKP